MTVMMLMISMNMIPLVISVTRSPPSEIATLPPNKTPGISTRYSSQCAFLLHAHALSWEFVAVSEVALVSHPLLIQHILTFSTKITLFGLAVFNCLVPA